MKERGRSQGKDRDKTNRKIGIEEEKGGEGGGRESSRREWEIERLKEFTNRWRVREKNKREQQWTDCLKERELEDGRDE